MYDAKSLQREVFLNDDHLTSSFTLFDVFDLAKALRVSVRLRRQLRRKAGAFC
jgi:hypothetical protein